MKKEEKMERAPMKMIFKRNLSQLKPLPKLNSYTKGKKYYQEKDYNY